MRGYVINRDASRSQDPQCLFHLGSCVAGGVQAVVNEKLDLTERAKQRGQPSSAGSLDVGPACLLNESGIAAELAHAGSARTDEGRSMLHSCRWSLRSSPSRTIRLVTPRATPVSTTTDGRRWSTVHQAARASDISASLYSPYVPRPNCSPVPGAPTRFRAKAGPTSRGRGGPWCAQPAVQARLPVGLSHVGGSVLMTHADTFGDE